MPLWLQIIAATLVLLAIVVLVVGWSDRRRWRRAASWPCPKCGLPFGAQTQWRLWAIKRHPRKVKCPTGGPILHCPVCQCDFAFDAAGRQVNDDREYV